MSTTPEIAIYEEAGELARYRLMERARALYGVVMGTDGETFGDTALSRSDRIIKWMNGVENGTVDYLAGISPTQYERFRRQFMRDIEAELEAQGVR